jgi:hypothetical protein
LKESDLYASLEKGGGRIALTIVSRAFRGGQELLIKVQIRYGTLHHSVSSCPSGGPVFSRRLFTEYGSYGGRRIKIVERTIKQKQIGQPARFRFLSPENCNLYDSCLRRRLHTGQGGRVKIKSRAAADTNFRDISLPPL